MRLATWLCVLGLLPLLPAQNSTKKVRPAPGDLAARAGDAVPWRKDLAAALAEAKQAGKPVFWYVPAVQPSPMDRKPEIDRYLRGGPFSWPSTIDLLATHFVPVAESAKGDAAKQRGLVRNQFLEPGYLVLDGDGNTLLRVDQLTTLHPEWFEAPLRRVAKAPADGFPCHPALREAWAAYRDGDRPAAQARAEAVLAAEPAPAVAAEAHWLVGAALLRSGQRPQALQRWTDLGTALPDQPLAWKAALEVEGHGPFGRGFEDYLPLPPNALAADPVDGTRLPGVYDEAELWRRGVAFLVAMDGGDGVLRDSIYDFGGTDGLPNVHAAVTCLAGEALLLATRKDAPFPLPAALAARAEATLQRMRANVEADRMASVSDRDEILWARAYALRFLAAWTRARGGDAEAVRPALQRGVAALVARQPETGVWFHEYGNPFAIATALQALHFAKQAGIEVPQDNVDKGLRALAMNRTDAGAFTYGHTAKGKPRASIESAAGRMPLCELGLYLFGGSDQDKLRAAVEAGQRHHGLLAAVRKYDDHADRHGYGGFFFWFDLLARAEAAARLDDAAARLPLQRQMRALVLDLPEFDGAFVDSHELGRCYGTAMALLALDALAAAR
ncbi:MAG: hypothetical protein ACK5AL_17445 [Planctomycetota bacterium]